MKIILNIFYLVVAFYGTLPLFRKELLNSVTRISIIRIIFIGIFILNILYIQSIGYNIEIDNGIFNLFTAASLVTSIKRKKENTNNLLWGTCALSLNTPSIITKSIITKAINDFWKSNVDQLSPNKHIIALFRIVSTDGIYETLGQMQKLNKEDKQYYITFINDILALKSNDYKSIAIKQVIINFGVRDGLALIKKEKTVKQTSVHQNYKHYKLPVTMDPLKYGNLLHIDKLLNMYLVQITPMTIAKIFVKDNGNKVEILRSGNIILSYEDKKINDNYFDRIIGSNHYHYIRENDTYKLDLFTVMKPVRFIEPKKEDKNSCNKIITMDIETYDTGDSEGNLTKSPYTLSWFNGKEKVSYYITDFNNKEELIIKAISDITKIKYQSYKIYLHNFGKFDAVFLMKLLTKIGIVTPLIHKGRIVTVSLSFSKKTNSRFYTIYFRDSYQILLASLRKLAKYFGVGQQKGIFPHRFVNKDNLNYVGAVPAFKYFDNINYQQYLAYCASFKSGYWCLKTESIKYCEQDCISLYQILSVFNNLIYNQFKINMNKYPTLSSLSFAIFLTHYLAKLTIKISMLAGKIAEKIRLSYTGGSTDMFIPTNEKDELVYGYDVNALYPSVMLDKYFPVGKPTYFEGNIRKYKTDAFGFFYCKITTPDNLDHPILQTHVKTASGLRTVSALGTYEDMLFSEEMDNAMKLGYKFEILWGYTFKKAMIFKDFVNELYDIRLQYPKEHPMNYIPKIIKNSLYGRMGMDDRFTYTHFIAKDYYLNFEKQYSDKILDIVDFDNSFLVEVETDDTRTMLDDRTESHKVNIAIASAITAYARIVMSQFKNNPKMKLFYTDTDSAYTNLNPDQMNALYPGIIDNKKLGKLKLETISSKAIFIAPKVYYLKTKNGEEICKVKGLDKNVFLTEQDFKDLLVKDKFITKYQDKWYRSLEDATIAVKNQVYTVQQTDNKRELIYDSTNRLIGTKPYTINNDKIIKNE